MTDRTLLVEIINNKGLLVLSNRGCVHQRYSLVHRRVPEPGPGACNASLRIGLLVAHEDSMVLGVERLASHLSLACCGSEDDDAYEHFAAREQNLSTKSGG